jgi:hypothetical protein
LNENKILREELESIEEDGTVEHNNAIKLREENAKLKIVNENLFAVRDKLEKNIEEYKRGNNNWMNLYQSVVDKNNELLKTNNRLTVDNNALLNKGGLKYMEAKLQIVQNGYDKCSRERDEYKHQLNAANKENEKLKKDIIDYVYEKDEEKSQYPIHWGGYDGAASAFPEEYSKWLNEQKDKAITKKEVEFNADSLDNKEQVNPCPCNKCKEYNQEKISWEQAASDLALRVVKLEEKVTELSIIKTSIGYKGEF